LLGEVAVVACEDTRTSRVLLDRYGIRTPTTSMHAHSQAHEVDALVSRLVAGDDVALISDAGTPLLSDPGGALVAAALTAGMEVVPVPGPSAVLAALAGAGVPADRFVFLGFLPRAEADQRELLGPLRGLPLAVVVYESPHRTPETLAMLARVLGERAACVARELTKKFEEWLRGTPAELSAELARRPRKGEFVVVIGPGKAASPAPAAEEVDTDDADPSVGEETGSPEAP
jgi:16S rRNA (cytidine1402-2'-O)-methyltransferase